MLTSGAPNGSVPQNICSSGTFLLAGRLWEALGDVEEKIVVGRKVLLGKR